jgi:hypothetical protein
VRQLVSRRPELTLVKSVTLFLSAALSIALLAGATEANAAGKRKTVNWHDDLCHNSVTYDPGKLTKPG